MDYRSQLAVYTDAIKEFCTSDNYPHMIEASFESLNDWSVFNNLDEVKHWFLTKKENSTLIVEDIPLNQAS